MILGDARVCDAIERAYHAVGYDLDLSRVRESKGARQASWVWLQRVHWGQYALDVWDIAYAYQGEVPVPSRVYDAWFGACHECAHLWQEQERGSLWYHGAVLSGVIRSLPGWWAHEKIPMEVEADALARKTWKQALNNWWAAKPLRRNSTSGTR